LEKNPGVEVRGHACFSLAVLLKSESNEGMNDRAAEEAGRLFERVMADYGGVKSEGKTLAERAGPELSELRILGVGRVAPEIEGEDLEGGIMKLSDYRGNVIVVTFWGTWCGPCMQMVPDEKRLAERLAGKPFALVGINSDTDQAKVFAAVKKEKITWRSFRDGNAPGPIATAWNVHSWPTVYVLDRKGVIRYRDVREQALSDAVDTLMAEP
jgi:thiol-disulfide isomerase/thioredoxin